MCILLGSLAALRARQGLRPPGLVLGDGRDWLLRGKICFSSRGGILVRPQSSIGCYIPSEHQKLRGLSKCLEFLTETTEYREHSSKRAATPLSPILDAVLAKSIFERISLVGVLASKTF